VATSCTLPFFFSFFLFFEEIVDRSTCDWPAKLERVAGSQTNGPRQL